MARGITMKGRNTMLLVRDVITRHVTANPSRIQDILKQTQNVRLTQAAIRNAIKNIRADDGMWVDSLAETVYGATVHGEAEAIEDHIDQMNVRMQQADTPSEYATMMNTLLKLYERRQYVMEELALYPRLVSGNQIMPQTDVVRAIPDEKPSRKRKRPALKAGGA